MTNVLDAILEQKATEVAELRQAPRGGLGEPRGARVLDALRRPAASSLRLITEIKRRSPSAGSLSTKLSVAERALAYAKGGAAMISVLSDARFFDGSWDHVREAKIALESASLDVPILAKEFVIDARQIDEAAFRGASSVLLIARIVDRRDLATLVEHARAAGLEPLVEVVTEAELEAAIDADARVIGVNARDLDTLVMDAARAERVLAAIPADRIAVHLSGLKSPADVRRIATAPRGGGRIDAALIGEALMREDDPKTLLDALIAVC